MTQTNDLFVRAARKKYRYPSVRGDLTTEQLWELPLLARNILREHSVPAFDLDSVARGLNAELKALGEESFVEAENPQRAVVAGMLEVVKVVIATKQAEANKAEARLERASQRRKILNAIAKQEDHELSATSKDELLKRLETLEAAD